MPQEAALQTVDGPVFKGNLFIRERPAVGGRSKKLFSTHLSLCVKMWGLTPNHLSAACMVCWQCFQCCIFLELNCIYASFFSSQSCFKLYLLRIKTTSPDQEHQLCMNELREGGSKNVFPFVFTCSIFTVNCHCKGFWWMFSWLASLNV